MRGRLRVHAALAAALTCAVGTPNVMAYSPGNGNSGDAPGQARAAENCSAAVSRQSDAGVVAHGGEKDDSPGPANCDHAWNS